MGYSRDMKRTKELFELAFIVLLIVGCHATRKNSKDRGTPAALPGNTIQATKNNPAPRNPVF